MLLASVAVMLALAWFVVVCQQPHRDTCRRAGVDMTRSGRRELTWRSGLHGIVVVVAASFALAAVGGLLALLMWLLAT